MTRALGLQDTTGLHRSLNEARDWVQLEGKDNWFFGGVLGAVADALNAIVEFAQELISVAAFPRPVPEIGWLGVIALLAWLTYAFAGLAVDDPGDGVAALLRLRRAVAGQPWTC